MLAIKEEGLRGEGGGRCGGNELPASHTFSSRYRPFLNLVVLDSFSAVQSALAISPPSPVNFPMFSPVTASPVSLPRATRGSALRQM